MTAQQRFWDAFYGWSLGLGFILAAVIVTAVCVSLRRGGFLRGMLIRWQQHRLHQRKLEAMAKLARTGLDAGYAEFLDARLAKEIPAEEDL